MRFSLKRLFLVTTLVALAIWLVVNQYMGAIVALNSVAFVCVVVLACLGLVRAFRYLMAAVHKRP